MAELSRVRVALGERAYDVVLADGLVGLGEAVRAATGARRAVLVTDDVVAPLWADPAVAALDGLRVDRVVFPSGEANKTLATWAAVLDGLLGAGVDRRTAVVALGGGVVGDVAGFAAASALRGLPLVQVPTTLLAMVDSSVGGKTGVNHAAGKNLVGAFYQPALVWAATDTLDTLDPAERRAGLGEVLKTALIGDLALLGAIDGGAEALAAGDADATRAAVARCVAAKAAVVAADEREGGLRAVLNAGHTVGHGLERALGYGVLRHGEAVGLGLVAEAAWAVREGLCEDPALPERIVAWLARLGLPATTPAVDPAAVARAAAVDKKATGDTVTVPLPVRAGVYTLRPVPLARLAELVSELP